MLQIALYTQTLILLVFILPQLLIVYIRLVGTYLQCTMHTRCTKRANTNDGHLSIHPLLDKGAGVLGLGLRLLTIIHYQLYTSSPTTSISTFSAFMVQISSPNLEVTKSGGRRSRLCVANGRASSFPRRRTSSMSSVSVMTTPRCSIGIFQIKKDIPSHTCLSVRPSCRSISAMT
ncbi:hypothetical protein EI94DRAFT_490413 [Lactarius quietus]|nr:hypothetical protein EI94DRAFT_490413 [Lactarius quietus]